MALPGVSDGGAHTKFITTGRYATEMLALLGARARDHVARGGALAAVGVPGAWRSGCKDRGSLAEGKPADVIVYDPDTVDCLDQERLCDYPADEWRLVQKADGLRPHHRERCDHVRRRRVHRRDARPAAPARHGLTTGRAG